MCREKNAYIHEIQKYWKNRQRKSPKSRLEDEDRDSKLLEKESPWFKADAVAQRKAKDSSRSRLKFDDPVEQ